MHMDAINMFDDCILAVNINKYMKEIQLVLDDNFNLNVYFRDYFKEKKNTTMIIDRVSNERLFRERHPTDTNIFTASRIVTVHYFLQIAVWIIYNSFPDQPETVSEIFNNFYDYMFGPILTSIVFKYDKEKEYFSEIPSTYLQMQPLLVFTN